MSVTHSSSSRPRPGRPVPDDLLPWAAGQLPAIPDGAQLVPVAGDASNRRYFRVPAGTASVVVMDAPPATEKNAAFLAVREALEAGGVRVPRLLAADLERGYLLLEDLGDQLLLPLLASDTVDDWYLAARRVLVRLARVDAAGVPDYDRALLEEELGRLPAWFLERLLGLTLSATERDLIGAVTQRLVASALEQPRVLVHRDFHSRNLMPQPDGELAVIDFQDAVCGPVTYDLVSLLRDCYIRWPRELVRCQALAHRDLLCGEGLLAPVEDETFLRWLDLMGLQRHLKVLGTFARLHLRDAKPGYLHDLPRVLAYVEEVLAAHAGDEPLLAEFGSWWERRVAPVVALQDWAV